jgi:hypothetical protein
MGFFIGCGRTKWAGIEGYSDDGLLQAFPAVLRRHRPGTGIDEADAITDGPANLIWSYF